MFSPIKPHVDYWQFPVLLMIASMSELNIDAKKYKVITVK